MRTLLRLLGSILLFLGLGGLVLTLSSPFFAHLLPASAQQVLAGTWPDVGAVRAQPALLPTLEPSPVPESPNPVPSPTTPPEPEPSPTAAPANAVSTRTQSTALATLQSSPTATALPSPTPISTPTPIPVLPITRVRISDVPIDAEVVVSKLVEVDGGVTWEVPAFKVGHAEYTAGAGEVGNAILLGHVTSRSLGNVFEHLDKVRVGYDVEIFTLAARYVYTVVEVLRVPRTEVSVLDPTEEPTVSLITCTGLWNPLLKDYMERLVVRGELARVEPHPAR